MANITKQINQYTAAVTIDPVVDYFLIDPAGTGAYLKINRNTIMGVSGTPADISTAQTFTNKVIGNTNTITGKDGSTTLQNTSDTTKQAKFSLASITTGNTRTYTLPDISDTLATLTATQTLTNKTLTSPTINSPTITNASITADSITGYTTSNSGNIYGVPITTGAISNSSAFGAGVILPSALLTGTGSSWVWQSWTPTFTNFTLGNGSVGFAKYLQTGKVVNFRILVNLGSTSSVSGALYFTVPVTSQADYYSTELYIGYGVAEQPGTTNAMLGVQVYSATLLRLRPALASSTYVQFVTDTSSTVPFTWATGNYFYAQGTYEAA